MNTRTTSRSNALFGYVALVATALTLVFVPALYAAWLRVRRNSAEGAPTVASLAAAA